MGSRESGVGRRMLGVCGVETTARTFMSEAWRSFEDLECWQACRDLRLHVQMQIVPRLPRDEAYRLKDQILRSSRSSTANIAEGYGRYHYLDKARFFGNARGSCCETLDHAITAADNTLVGPGVLARTRELVERSVRLVNGYMRYLRDSAQDLVAREPAAEGALYTCGPADPSGDTPPVSPLPPPATRIRRSKPRGKRTMLRYSRAFTLIEMLVVMGIIGILVALLFPAIKKAIEAAERTDAERMAMAIDNAIRTYNTEYGRFPLQNDSLAQYEYKTSDTARGYVKLIATLRGLDATENPKGIPFLDVTEKQLLDSGPMAGALVDPWDAPFRVWVDWNNDNIINTGAGAPYAEVRGRQVIVWSPGPDRVDGTASGPGMSNRLDNATSWGT